jgi:hypothetical protein
MFCTFTSLLPQVYVQGPTWLFSVVPLLRAIQVGSSGVFWMINRCFQLPLLFLASILLLNPTYPLFLPHGLDVNNFLGFISDHVCVSWIWKIYSYKRSFIIITDYDVRCVVWNGSVGLHFALVRFSFLGQYRLGQFVGSETLNSRNAYGLPTKMFRTLLRSSIRCVHEKTK